MQKSGFPKLHHVEFSQIRSQFTLAFSLQPNFPRVLCMHNSRHTLLPLVGLMCRLLSNSVSSLLLSLTPKLYPALYFIMVKLNQ